MTDKNKQPHPLVSIVIPVYNGEDYLREAINSALSQSYSNCEVIVVNDGSTDNGATRAIAMSFRDRIKYFEKENGGTASALNFAIQNARGEYISWLSHDDLYSPDKVQRQISFLNTLTDNNVVIYSEFEAIDVEHNKVSLHAVSHLDPYDYMQDTIMILFTSCLHGCSFLLPKSCFSEVGYFDGRFRTAQDYHMWFKLLKSGYKFVHCPGVLVQARRHKNQGSRAMSCIQRQERENLHLWAADEFFGDIATFPPRTVWNIIMIERRLQSKCANVLLTRIRKEKPVLYSRLYAYRMWLCAQKVIHPLAMILPRRLRLRNKAGLS